MALTGAHLKIMGLACGLALCACAEQDQQTAFDLEVRFGAQVSIDQVRVTLVPEGDTGPEPGLVPEPPAPLRSGQQVRLLVSDDWHGKTVTVRVSGLLEGHVRAVGESHGVVSRNHVVPVRVLLEPPCHDECPLGDGQCIADALRRCELNAEGCTRWQPPEACPIATPHCSKGRCAAVCEDECTSGERRCTDKGFQVCGAHDSDDCLDWGPTLGCGERELCREGACLPDCGGKPCQCSVGQTSSCADVGECRNGERPCNDGFFGRCEWAQDKTPEICDGKDNDCNNAVDDSLRAEACAEQRGVCRGALKKCGGSAGWLTCGATEYTDWATSQKLVYQLEETLCDGKDNDCDGQVDEPAKCCQPDCSGKPCGADNGCGSTCQSGSCQANATCQRGACICDTLACGKVCCTSGQSCQDGVCQANTCKPVGPTVVSMESDANLSVALDAKGKVHISYRRWIADGQGELGYATNASGTWVDATVPVTGDIGHDTSIGIDGAGKVHIAHYAETPGDLMYSTNASGGWVTVTVDSDGDVGSGPSLAVDSAKKAHVSYRDATNQSLKYATNATGAWVNETVHQGNEMGWDSSLALDKANKVHISYFDNREAALWYASNASGSWVKTPVEDKTLIYWSGSSLAIDSKGAAHIAYVEDTSPRRLKVATNATGSWVKSTAFDGPGLFVSLAFDGADKAHMSFYDTSTPVLRYGTNASGSWQWSKPEPRTGDVGYSNALAVTESGAAAIAYHSAGEGVKYLVICP